MNETAARRVLLIQALETPVAGSALWTPEDAAWASRVARESLGPDAPPESAIAERAAQALQRLGPRAPALARWCESPPRLARWLGAVTLGALLIGLLADSIGSAQRINLLAPPIWTVVAWNLAIYAGLIVRATRGVWRLSSPRSDWLGRQLQALIEPRSAAPRADGAGTAAVLQACARAWATCSAALSGARATALLHAGAAALALGLIAGLYLRGLVLDYRVGWQSTFLEAPAVHSLLSVALGPAAALSGLRLPDASAVAALRVSPSFDGAVASGAAAWIHLYALTLALAVVAPRSALAAWQLWRARRLSQRVAPSFEGAYFQRLVRAQRDGQARVQVRPYAQAPGPTAALGLREALATHFGATVQLEVLAPAPYGTEPAAMDAPAGTAAVVVLFDLGATPERETQGRFVRALVAAGGVLPRPPVLLVVDESAFRRRFGADLGRLSERRAAWQAFAGELGTVAVFLALDQPVLPDTERALLAALDRPVSAGAVV